MPTIDTQRRRRPAACLCLALLLGLLASPAAWSADKDNAGQVRALQQRLRAAEQDKARLAAERVELDGQAKEAADKLVQSRRSADAVNRQRQALAKDLDAMTAEKAALAEQIAKAGSELTELKAQLVATQGGLERTQGQLGRTESQRAQLERALTERIQVLNECTARNDELTQTAAGLLAELGVQGLGRPLEGEPLTQLARVAVENKLGEYRERIDRAQFAPAAQQRRETTQLWAAQQRQAEASAQRSQVEQARTAREQVAGEKARQQSDLDRLTRRVREYFEGLEW